MTKSKADKYRGHSDPTIGDLALQLVDAEAELLDAERARSTAALNLNNRRADEEAAKQRVERLADALAVLAGDPEVRVERSRSPR